MESLKDVERAQRMALLKIWIMCF